MTLSLFFLFNHPLPLVIVLISHTLILIANLYLNSETPWLSFVTFLIYLGGLLIIFIYLAALTPNEIIYTNHLAYLFLFTPVIFIFFCENKANFNSLDIINNFRHNTQTSTIVFFLFYIMAILCIIMFLCTAFKTPLKQDNY